jgi:uncharacterized protein YcfJ
MMKSVMAFAGAAALFVVPNVTVAQEGTATGAAAGAIVGGVVGGPVGAAVGAGVGAATGAAGDAANRKPDTVIVQPDSTGSVRQRSTTCVQGAASATCTETEVRR